MNAKQIHDALVKRFGGSVITALNDQTTDPWIEVAPSAIAEVGHFLKHDPALRFDMLCNLCGVDFFEPEAKLAKNFPYEPHIAVVYHLLSISLKHKITIKVKLPRWKADKAGELPEIPSVSSIWAVADWHEREAYDMFGINFIGHPNLVRILCPDDWEGYPLRKDYKFPLEYHGVRGM